MPTKHPGARTRLLDRWKARTRELERDTYALYLAARDPRVRLHAKLLVALIVAYALSPIDLVPDFIPVLGYVDDLVLIPLGIMIALKLVSPELLAEHRASAAAKFANGAPRSVFGAAVVVMIWCALVSIVLWAW
jgi:uncharacterized membrane protein YkvA (DUF1232 family)